MPEVINFTVTQTRMVEVRANNAVDAAQIAEAAFVHGQDSNGAIARGKGPASILGNTTTRIKEIALLIQTT